MYIIDILGNFPMTFFSLFVFILVSLELFSLRYFSMTFFHFSFFIKASLEYDMKRCYGWILLAIFITCASFLRAYIHESHCFAVITKF